MSECTILPLQGWEASSATEKSADDLCHTVVCATPIQIYVWWLVNGEVMLLEDAFKQNVMMSTVFEDECFPILILFPKSQKFEVECCPILMRIYLQILRNSPFPAQTHHIQFTNGSDKFQTLVVVLWARLQAEEILPRITHLNSKSQVSIYKEKSPGDSGHDLPHPHPLPRLVQDSLP